MAVRLLLVLIIFLLVSCGQGPGKSTPVLLKGQVTSGLPQEYQDKIGLITGLMRHDLFLDHDRDGILDRDDPDIDNDDIPNDCDSAPFDPEKGREDLDQDGIPDFCDNGSELQKTVFARYGILLNMNEEFEDFDPAELLSRLKYISSVSPLPHEALKTLTLTDSLPWGELGVYDRDWHNIRFRPDETPHDEFPGIKLSSWTLVHELFHFVEVSRPDFYQEFAHEYQSALKGKTLKYSTHYAQVSEEEFFAERYTLRYFIEIKALGL